MNTIVEILCRRDGISFNEATRQVNRVRKEIYNSNLSYDEVEQIMADELGLEMDYIFDLM